MTVVLAGSQAHLIFRDDLAGVEVDHLASIVLGDETAQFRRDVAHRAPRIDNPTRGRIDDEFTVRLIVPGSLCAKVDRNAYATLPRRRATEPADDVRGVLKVAPRLARRIGGKDGRRVRRCIPGPGPGRREAPLSRRARRLQTASSPLSGAWLVLSMFGRMVLAHR
jgi:hypothetical protein